MPELPIDEAVAARALEAAVTRASLLLGGVRDTSVVLRDSEWSVRDAAAHVISYAGLWVAAFRGDPSPVRNVARLARHNERLLGEVKERDGRALADRLARDYDGMLAAAERVPSGTRVPWLAGTTVGVAGAYALALSEILVHGFDIARAVRAPWPITPHDAALAVAGATRMMPVVVDREKATGIRIACGFRLRTMPEFAVVVDGGDVTVEVPPQSPVDCRLSGDPTTFLLASYGRVPQWSAALRGKLRAGGRNPWLVARFNQLVKAP